jgi:arylsulfatase A-like enzyme
MPFNRRYFLFGALAAPALAAKKKRATVERPNVVLIAASDVGAYMVGCYENKVVRTPSIDHLALTGVRFSNTFCGVPASSESAAALQEAKLAEALGAAGYNCAPSTAKAGEFLDAQTPAKQFFLTVALPSPLAVEIPQKNLDLFAAAAFESIGWEAAAPNATHKDLLADVPGNLRKYAAGLATADQQVGEVLARLQQRGLLDSTLVIFISRNGYLLGRHGLWGDGRASDPVNMFEEVVRVPMIWTWPLRFPPQTVRNEVVSIYDLLPTVCELSGAAPPAGSLPGRSYLTFVYGRRLPKKQTWRGMAFARLGSAEMAREERYKLILRDQGKGPNELYDLVADGRETTNQYDNPQFVSVRDQLAAALTAWRSGKS